MQKNSKKTLSDNLAEKCYLETDDATLGMILLSKDTANPVLLVCGGGPGIPEYLLESLRPSGLADIFTVCYPDYRGAGLSYAPDNRLEDMTTQNYITDVIKITEYLRKRFSQEKIYILGHSFGSYIALKTVQQSPEYYHAYIAMSQICNQMESEYLAYDYMLEQYRESGNTKMVRKLEKYPIRQSPEIWKTYQRKLRDTVMHDLGVGTMREMKSVISGIFFPSLRCKAYTPEERIHIWRGKSFLSHAAVSSDSFHFNAFEDVKSVSVPIYFFAGIYDYTCCYALQEQYCHAVNAPHKEFYCFENSAHSPLFEEPERACGILKNLFTFQTV